MTENEECIEDCPERFRLGHPGDHVYKGIPWEFCVFCRHPHPRTQEFIDAKAAFVAALVNALHLEQITRWLGRMLTRGPSGGVR